MSAIEEVSLSSVGDGDPKTFIALGIHQHDSEHEPEEGESEYTALLHSISHYKRLECRSVYSDARHHPVVDLTYHVREPIRTVQFPCDFPKAIRIHHVNSFRQIHKGHIEALLL
ncbi:unnamed protein product [Dibothriocephalus latus]|uniref:Uncharacterized protein n=1 Tax=Dibothriocephalus latus TaxID=60516 RepID=A0A3P7NKM6_DIBLA|nr:unnamed protein product [Dibothriocephalus latus]